MLQPIDTLEARIERVGTESPKMADEQADSILPPRFRCQPAIRCRQHDAVWIVDSRITSARIIRGRRAARIVLLAYLLLTLAYPGVKFVTDVILA